MILTQIPQETEAETKFTLSCFTGGVQSYESESEGGNGSEEGRQVRGGIAQCWLQLHEETVTRMLGGGKIEMGMGILFMSVISSPSICSLSQFNICPQGITSLHCTSGLHHPKQLVGKPSSMSYSMMLNLSPKEGGTTSLRSGHQCNCGSTPGFNNLGSVLGTR